MKALKVWAFGAGLLFAACGSGDDGAGPAGAGGNGAGTATGGSTAGGGATVGGAGGTSGGETGGSALMPTAGAAGASDVSAGGAINDVGGAGGVAAGGAALGGAAGFGGEAGGGVSQCPDWTVGGIPDVDDAGWQGAPSVDFPDYLAQGAIAARSRLAEDNGTLFLQLRILVDATPGNSSSGNFRDSVYVAFADDALATIQAVRVAIDTAGTTHATRWMKSNGTWTSGPATTGSLPWLSAFTAWVNPPVSGADAVSWAVNFKLATASAPGLTLWYALTISPSGVAASQTFAWPDRGSFVEPNPPDTGAPASTWGAQFASIGAAHWATYTAALAKQCDP